jgi:predicted DNA-binding transcriptional regulator AlpA
MDSFKLLGLSELQARVPLGKSRIYEMQQRGEFPLPYKVGRRALWAAHEIDEWCRKLFAKRDAQAGGQHG